MSGRPGDDYMKYWKGRAGTAKQGQYGTMEDNGSVPDSDEVTKIEYGAYIASLPATQPQPDYKAQYAAATTTNQQIQVLAKALGLI